MQSRELAHSCQQMLSFTAILCARMRSSEILFKGNNYSRSVRFHLKLQLLWPCNHFAFCSQPATQLKKVLHNFSQNKVEGFAAHSNMCMNGSQQYKNDPAGGRNRTACYKNKHPCVISVSSFVSSLLCMNTSDGLLLSSRLVVCLTKDEIW